MCPLVPHGVDNHELTTSNTTTNTTVPTSPSHIIYLVGKSGGDTCMYLHCSSSEPFVGRCASTPDTFEPGNLYCLQWSLADPGHSNFLALSERTINSYVRRGNFTFTGGLYESTVLRSLLLGRRIADYQENCSRIIQRYPLMIRTRARPGPLIEMNFRSENGEALNVRVDNVSRRGEQQSGMMTLSCTPLDGPLFSGSTKNSRLYPVDDDWGDSPTPIVTSILESVFRRERPVHNQLLLDRIYGDTGAFTYRPVDSKILFVSKEGGDVPLNAEISEVIHRYEDPRCPGFVVEAPQGLAKSMALAAMAMKYSGSGLQLFLAASDTAVFEMADALASIDHQDRTIYHIVSPDVEELLELQSPFATLETFDEDDCQVDIMLATTDRILEEVEKVRVAGAPCPIQDQLMNDVTCVVIDEGTQMTEATLNALFQSFPALEKVVLFGHPLEPNPYNYQQGEVGSELAARPAFEVMTKKKNLPVIKMKSKYEEQQPLPRQPAVMSSRSRHYEKMVYQVRLARNFPDLHESDPEEHEQEPPLVVAAPPPAPPNLVSNIFKTISRLSVKRLPGNGSIFNDEEVSTLQYVQAKLAEDGYTHSLINIIVYNHGRLEHAEMKMPTEPYAAGVDLELSNELSSRTAALFSSNSRLNGSEPALIILGPETIRRTAPWQTLVSGGHFAAVVSTARL